ncbi:hypothetical protein Prudu_021828, partial [Prunus dulcis]
DLGQSFDSNKTLTHYELNPQKGQAVLFVGASLMQITTQIMIMSGGIHGEDSPREVLHINPGYGLQGIMKLILPQKLVKPNLLSLTLTDIMSHIKHQEYCSLLVLNQESFSIHHSKYTPQYKWLEQELPKVNRSETPWLIVLMHSPWYNSYNYHYMEGEP